MDGGRQAMPKDTPNDRTKMQVKKLQEEREQVHLELDRLREALKIEVDPERRGSRSGGTREGDGFGAELGTED